MAKNSNAYGACTPAAEKRKKMGNQEKFNQQRKSTYRTRIDRPLPGLRDAGAPVAAVFVCIVVGLVLYMYLKSMQAKPRDSLIP